MEYGSRNGKDLRMAKMATGSERMHDFMDFGGVPGKSKKAPRPGREEANEGTSGEARSAGRGGDQKSNDEPG
jgi:hypothetical protein